MKVTIIFRNKTEVFWTGNGGSIPGFLNQEDGAKFAHAERLRQDNLADMKVGSGSFRDRVELNQLLRLPHTVTFKLEPRRGYKLGTFEFACA